MENGFIIVPPALVLGCNTPHGINVLSDWIEEQIGHAPDLVGGNPWDDMPGYVPTPHRTGNGAGDGEEQYGQGDGFGCGLYGSVNGDGRGDGLGYAMPIDGAADGCGSGYGYLFTGNGTGAGNYG